MPMNDMQYLAAYGDFDKDVLVSAGAGSGKTQVLTSRVTNLIEKGVKPTELLVLTFTNAAAAEMKSRVRGMLSERQDLRDSISLLEQAYITTFDSFNLSMCKKYFYALNVSPNIGICDASSMKIKKIENFKEMSKKQKRRSLIISSILFLIGVGIIVSFCFYEKIYGADSIFQKDYFNNQILNGIVHIVPSILNTLTIVVICYFLNKLLKWILTKCFAKTNRGITILRLLHSFLRWMIVIIAAFAILSTWGVNTSTLLASAGVLTLVIGLGAQSLVADVVAGLFIVIEGEYLVGDIVVIDGWRGTVKEIGIRTTKVEDAGGNLLIINNSEIKSLINQTTELSVAKCVMSVDYSEDIERVEEVIKSNLEEIGKNIPGIIEGPFYKGINELADSSVDVLMVAKCKEEDIYQVQRDMTKQFYLLFNKNNINIPYNQIVVTNAENIKKK